METINSAIKLALPVSPSTQQPNKFNELLATYSSIRAVHSALTQILVEDNTAALPPMSDISITDLFVTSSRSKVLVLAGDDIQAGKFLELYVSGGEARVRHTRCLTDQNGTSWNVLGISLKDAAAGEITTVYVEPAIIQGFTGLIPGTRYYAYDAGQFVVNSLVYPATGGPLVLVKTCCVALTDKAVRLASFWVD